MTKLQPDKPITRETALFERGDPLVVTMHPKYLEIRPKGARAASAIQVSYDAIYDLGRKLKVRRTS
jgi:hypothetical protein